MNISQHNDITWFPNSWIRLRISGNIIYFDPAYLNTFFKKYLHKTEFSKWPDAIDGLPDGLEKADYIFITHHHKDHCKKVTVERLRKPETLIYAPKPCKAELGDIFTIIKANDKIQFSKSITLEVVEACNTPEGSSTSKPHKKGMGVGYILTIDKKRFYHLGDTDYLPEMAAIKNIDIAFVPIGGKFTMDMHEAFEAVRAINPRVVIPIHKLNADFNDFRAMFKSEKTKCIVPEIGKPIPV